MKEKIRLVILCVYDWAYFVFLVWFDAYIDRWINPIKIPDTTNILLSCHCTI